MDIVRFKGGLGNQMFQYALMLALQSRGRNVYGNLGFYREHKETREFILNDVFEKVRVQEVDDSIFNDINQKWKMIKGNPILLENFINNVKDRFFYVEKEDGIYDKQIFETENCTFVGYWQSERYFKNIMGQVKKTFSFENLEPKLVNLGGILKEQYVSIHVRRGDYLKHPEIYDTCDEEYYKRAISYFQKKWSGIRFIFFSDDKDWVKQKFLVDGIICEENMFEHYQDWYDMYLMSCCRGNIVANSSFSWWGAWLNENPGKIVIAPSEWIVGKATYDIWCDEWIKM